MRLKQRVDVHVQGACLGLPPPGLPEALAVRPGRFLRYRHMGAYVSIASSIVSGGLASIILLPLDSALGDGLRMYRCALALVQY